MHTVQMPEKDAFAEEWDQEMMALPPYREMHAIVT